MTSPPLLRAGLNVNSSIYQSYLEGPRLRTDVACWSPPVTLSMATAEFSATRARDRHEDRAAAPSGTTIGHRRWRRRPGSRCCRWWCPRCGRQPSCRGARRTGQVTRAEPASAVAARTSATHCAGVVCGAPAVAERRFSGGERSTDLFASETELVTFDCDVSTYPNTTFGTPTLCSSGRETPKHRQPVAAAIAW